MDSGHLARLGVVIGALALAACGPIRSSSTIVDASAELAAAETAQGRALSPYEMVAAEAYLHKAREEESYSDFEVAARLARKARDCARVARLRAERQTRKDIGAAPSTTAATDVQCYAGPPGERPVQGLDVPDGKTPAKAAAAPATTPAPSATPAPAAAPVRKKPAKPVKPKDDDEPSDPVLPEGE